MTGSPADNAGLKIGDVILEIDGNKFKRITEVIKYLEMNNTDYLTITVARDGEILPSFRLKMTKSKNGRKEVGLRISSRILIKPRPVFIDSIMPNSPAALSGLKANDILLEINNEVFNSINDFNKKRLSNVGKEISITLVRNNEKINTHITPTVFPKSLGATLGFLHRPSPPVYTMELSHAIKQGLSYTIYTTTIPLLLVGQLVEGFVNPYGIYTVWTSFGIDSLRLFGLLKVNFKYRIAFLLICILGVLTPFMITLEYVHTIKMIVMMFKMRAMRYAITTIFVGIFTVLIYKMIGSGNHIQIYELNYIEEFLQLTLSVWAI